MLWYAIQILGTIHFCGANLSSLILQMPFLSSDGIFSLIFDVMHVIILFKVVTYRFDIRSTVISSSIEIYFVG